MIKTVVFDRNNMSITTNSKLFLYWKLREMVLKI